MLISELMAKELAAEGMMTRRLLARIPNDKLSWQAAEGLHSISWNAAHIIEIVEWVPGIVSESEFDISPVGAAPYVAPEASTVEQLLEQHDASIKKAVAALQGTADSVLDEPWSLKMGGQTLFTMCKGECLRKWVFSHLAHHRGILSVYLKLAGDQFPSIYEE